MFKKPYSVLSFFVWILYFFLGLFDCLYLFSSASFLLEVGCLERHAEFKLWDHHGFIKWHNDVFALVFHSSLIILAILFSFLTASDP